MSWTGGMDALEQLRHLLYALPVMRHRFRDPIALRLFKDGRGAQGQKSDHGTHFESGGTAIGESEDVIVKTVLLIPHAIIARLVYRCGDPQKVLEEFRSYIVE